MNKQDFFQEHQIKHIDYKATGVLKKFINANGRILARRITGLNAKNQKKVAQAVKRARFMGLIPYINR